MQKLVLSLILLSCVEVWCKVDKPYTTTTTSRPTNNSSTQYARCESAVFPEPTCCGVHNLNSGGGGLRARIFGGRETRINEYPWLVYINIRKIFGSGLDFCTGSIINTRWVLTAAHCFSDPRVPLDIPMSFGEWNLNEDPDCEYSHCAPKVVKISANKIIPHPQYTANSQNHSNDLALIHLSESLQYSEFIQPICLLWDGLLDNDELIGKVAEVAGWGRTEFNMQGSSIKMKTKVKVQASDKCKSKSKNAKGGLLNNNYQICAGGHDGVDSCNGDAGAPLMMPMQITHDGHKVAFNSPYYHIGLASYSENCGIQGTPGVYTRTTAYLRWIRETIRNFPAN